MHQEKPKQSVKTLSIRIPYELYMAVSQYALDNELPSLNAAATELITAGVQTAEDHEKIISQFILEFIPKEQLDKLIHAK